MEACVCKGVCGKEGKMKIARSSIAMQSDRQYYQSGMRLKDGASQNSFENVKNALSFKGSFGNGTGGFLRDSFSKNRGVSEESSLGMMTYTRLSGTSSRQEPRAEDYQYSLLYLLIKRLMLYGLAGLRGNSPSFGMFPGQPGGYLQQFSSYEEYEETSFQAEGQAVTEDGRKISFGIEVAMSRSYMEYMSVSAPSVADALCDPLVINVKGGVSQISDQKFLFDIDADGKKDEISQTAKGSGFLAFDRNGDGQINDGSELFGTKSGDGFAELAAYDEDGNGWIDENDDIFSKLKVWCRSDHGEDILMDLKAADVGAIYLDSAKTQFTLGRNDGSRNGVVRSTGFFLHESTGMPGTIQHIDMAVPV